MDTTVGKELAALQRLGVPQLKARYAELFGEQPSTKNRVWLVKRLAWRLQALAEGDLSERARKRAAELANDADLRTTPPREKPAQAPAGRTVTAPAPARLDDRLPPPGTILTRPYKGRTSQVRVLADGFEYDGEVYASLSAASTSSN